MNQPTAQPSAHLPAALSWSPPAWAERAIGAAAAAVFLAGIVSAGLVESSAGPGLPDLAAPASAAAAAPNRATSSLDQLTLPPVYAPSGSSHSGTGTNKGTNKGTSAGSGVSTARGGSGITLDRGVGLTPTLPSSPKGSDSTSPPPSAPPATADPTPSLGVAVGPIAVGASPDGVGGNLAGTTVGDQTSVPTSSDGVTVDLQTGVTDPVTVSFP